MTVKIIGKFQEVDGEEFESIDELVKAKGLIGSAFDDAGDVELFYDTDGNTYAISRDAKGYYSAKERAMNGEPQPFVISAKSLLWTAGLIGLTIYVISNHRSARKHLKYIRN